VVEVVVPEKLEVARVEELSEDEALRALMEPGDLSGGD
jgi:hypothetical protein